MLKYTYNNALKQLDTLHDAIKCKEMLKGSALLI